MPNPDELQLSDQEEAPKKEVKRKPMGWRNLLPLLVGIATAAFAGDYAGMARLIEELIRGQGTADGKAALQELSMELLTRSETSDLMEPKPRG